MTVSTQTSQITYTGDGATTTWSFPFPGVSASNIVVFITDLSSNVTQLNQNAYSVSLNPPVAPNPTSIGGAVNVVGSPLAVGFKITIMRVLPSIQPASLSNQSIIYPPVVEQELDYLTMLDQQSAGDLARAIKVSRGDPLPADLPPVGIRANQSAFFDSLGNLVPGLPPIATAFISAVMQPVVAAGTLQLARQLMGVDAPLRYVTASQAPLVSNHNFVDIAQGAGTIVYNLNPANTYFNGFGFYVDVVTPTVGVLLVPGAGGDQIGILPPGQAFTLAQGSYIYIQTDGNTRWFVRYLRQQPPTYSVLTATVSSTYLIKPGCSILRVAMVGAGGAGGTGAAGGSAGTAGAFTIFQNWSAGGGGGGANANGASRAAGGLGATAGASGPTGTQVKRVNGQSGSNGVLPAAGGAGFEQSGAGGASYIGNGGLPCCSNDAPVPGGFGGGGAGGGDIGALGTGGGGGAGQYVEFWLPVIGISFITYNAGLGGTNASTGALVGSNGIIFVEEFYGVGGP